MPNEICNIKVIAIDLDGVVYLGDSVIPHVPETLSHLREIGYKLCYVTNNSSKNSQLIAEKLQGFNIECSPKDVYCSAEIAKCAIENYLKNDSSSIYIVGSKDLKESICSIPGIRYTENNPDILLIGLDIEFNYKILSTALLAARSGAYIIACNREKNYPDSGGIIRPGCGPIVAAIETACEREADVVIGKPGLTMLNLLCKENRVDANNVLIVGDSLDSDIAMANAFGSISVLISKTGIESVSQHLPNYILPSLNRLPDILTAICPRKNLIF